MNSLKYTILIIFVNMQMEKINILRIPVLIYLIHIPYDIDVEGTGRKNYIPATHKAATSLAVFPDFLHILALRGDLSSILCRLLPVLGFYDSDKETRIRVFGNHA